MPKTAALKTGFSLIECLVALTIMALAVLTVYSLFIVVNQTKRKADDQSELIQTGRAVLDRITRELRQANNLVTGLPTSQIKFEDGHDNLSTSATPLQYINYYPTGTDLKRKISFYYCSNDTTKTHISYTASCGSGSKIEETFVDDLVAQYITDINFTNSPTITVSLTLTLNNKSLTLSSNVTPRNN